MLLDMFSAHPAAATKIGVESLRIQLVFLLSNDTDTIQSLNRRVFGALKAHTSQLRGIQYHKTHGQKAARVQMAENLTISWEQITPDI
jgi:hypothetical protein